MKKTLSLALITFCIFSSQALAENKKDHGADFIKAAEKYELQAKKANDAGEVSRGSMYKKLAAIKRNAAKHARAGEWDKIDWTEYKAINKKLHGECKSDKKTKN